MGTDVFLAGTYFVWFAAEVEWLLAVTLVEAVLLVGVVAGGFGLA